MESRLTEKLKRPLIGGLDGGALGVVSSDDLFSEGRDASPLLQYTLNTVSRFVRRSTSFTRSSGETSLSSPPRSSPR